MNRVACLFVVVAAALGCSCSSFDPLGDDGRHRVPAIAPAAAPSTCDPPLIPDDVLVLYEPIVVLDAGGHPTGMLRIEAYAAIDFGSIYHLLVLPTDADCPAAAFPLVSAVFAGEAVEIGGMVPLPGADVRVAVVGLSDEPADVVPCSSGCLDLPGVASVSTAAWRLSY